MGIAAYGAAQQLTEAEIWRRLRRGELAGRKVGGQLVIYPPGQRPPTTPAPAAAATSEGQGARAGAAPQLSDDEVAELADLPPLPSSVPVLRAGASQEGGEYLSLGGERSSSPEMALLLDHLSLAKEENREILRMTQESLRKVSAMSDTIVRMKDALIASKDAELTELRAELAKRDQEIRRLRQHSEDLEMLTRTMSAAGQAARHD